MSYRIAVITIILSVFLFSQCKNAEEVKVNHPDYYENITTTDSGSEYGIVSAHILASEVAEDILISGGNAVDAYIACQFALAVVYPRAGNLGGGGFALISDKDSVVALDYREKAPARASRNMYLDENGDIIEDASTVGHLACGVPGTVAGMHQLFEKYSQLKNWKALVEPAINLAEKGFEVSPLEADRLNRYQDQFKILNPDNTSFVKETKWKSGDLLVQKDLAQTLTRIADSGKDGFYTGKTAQYIVDEMQEENGLISLDDLAAYKAVWRSPISVDYYGNKVYSMSPPSSGGIAMGQMLLILQALNIDTISRSSAIYVHYLVEAMRVAYEDRAKYLGDPDYFDVPTDQLLSSSHLASSMGDFSTTKARKSDLSDLKVVPLLKESFETTHTSIIDKNGMTVSGTTTINSNYGSKLIVDHAGFFLNNEMDDFSAKPGVPNQFGLVGAEANAVEPGKRMLSSMTPTIVLDKDGKPLIIIGTPGGSTIITAILNNLVNVINYDMPIDSSIATPRFHHQWVPDEIIYEPGAFSDEVRDSLQEMGHTLKEVSSIALVKGIHKKNGKIMVSGDPRSEDHAVAE